MANPIQALLFDWVRILKVTNPINCIYVLLPTYEFSRPPLVGFGRLMYFSVFLKTSGHQKCLRYSDFIKKETRSFNIE